MPSAKAVSLDLSAPHVVLEPRRPLEPRRTPEPRRAAQQSRAAQPEVEAPQRGAERTAAAVAELLPLLYRQVRSLAGPRRNLDDLVQAAAERALKALPRFEGRSALSTWTYSIAYRTIQDHDRWYRRWSRRFRLNDTETELESACPRDSSEVQLLQARRASRLYHHLEQLPATKRAVIVLHDLEELSVREIAEITQTGEATVRSRLRDGRRRLAELLRGDQLFSLEQEVGADE